MHAKAPSSHHSLKTLTNDNQPIQRHQEQNRLNRPLLNGWLKTVPFILLILLSASALCPALAQPVNATGKWKVDIETPIGTMNYTYILKQEGAKLTGKIIRELGTNKNESDLTEGQVNGDAISFVEIAKFQDNQMQIDYKGTVSADEIKFVRKVGDFGTANVIAKREKDDALLVQASKPPTPARLLNQRVVLNPDDKPAFAAAPEGFDKKRENIATGKVETVEYDSKTVGNKRKMLVYTPPEYSPDHKYPVLYLLHGIGGDEMEWYNQGAPNVILDNLYADKKLTPMIVVLPNGRAQSNDRAEGDIYRTAPAFENFGKDLLNDVIPFIESKYAVKSGPENRALAGLSMGGGQSLNFGLGNLNSFAWIGGFSSAPNQRSPEVLVPNPAETTQKLKLLWISCGDQDGLISFSQRLHKYLKENNVPHIWHVDSGKHEFKVWKNDLYLFSQLLFK